MKTSFLIIAMLSLARVSHAQFPTAAVVIPKSDAIYPALEKYQNGIEEEYRSLGEQKPNFGKWVELKTPTTSLMFPSLRFAGLVWDEVVPPDLKRCENANYAFGLQITLAVDTRQRETLIVLPAYGNYEEFGKLLASQRIRIRNPNDAKNVWDVFCTLHAKHWKKQPAESVSDTKWHLGQVTIRDFHYYYEVELDETKVVQRAKLHAVKVETAKSD